MNIKKIDPWSRRATAILKKNPYTSAELKKKLSHCGQFISMNGWDFRTYCKSIGCDFCRRKHIVKLEAEAQTIFGSQPINHLFFLTICLPTTQDIDEVPDIIRAGKRDLRNLVARWRSTSEKAKQCHFLGMAEVGYCPTSEYKFLGSDKVLQLDYYGVDPFWDHTYSPHFHLILDSGGANTANLMDLCDRKWPASKACHITPITPSIQNSIEDIICYITKIDDQYATNRHGWTNKSLTKYSNIPPNQIANLYSMIDQERNMQLLKVHVRPVGYRNTSNQSKTIQPDDLFDDYDEDSIDPQEALPIII